MSSFGRLFRAFFFSSSTARTYTSTYFRLLCPNRSATTLTLAPLFSNWVPKLWSPQCQVMCFLIPARFVQCRRAFKHIVLLGSGKMRVSSLASSGLSPISAIIVSVNGMTTPLFFPSYYSMSSGVIMLQLLISMPNGCHPDIKSLRWINYDVISNGMRSR